MEIVRFQDFGIAYFRISGSGAALFNPESCNMKSLNPSMPVFFS
jgi:hypothetical protein